MLVMCVYGPYFNHRAAMTNIEWSLSEQNMFFLAVKSANRLLGEGECRSEVCGQ